MTALRTDFIACLMLIVQRLFTAFLSWTNQIKNIKSTFYLVTTKIIDQKRQESKRNPDLIL